MDRYCDESYERKDDIRTRLRGVLRQTSAKQKSRLLHRHVSLTVKPFHFRTREELQAVDAFLRKHFPEAMAVGAEIPATVIDSTLAALEHETAAGGDECGTAATADPPRPRGTGTRIGKGGRKRCILPSILPLPPDTAAQVADTEARDIDSDVPQHHKRHCGSTDGAFPWTPTPNPPVSPALNRQPANISSLLRPAGGDMDEAERGLSVDVEHTKLLAAHAALALLYMSGVVRV